MTLEEKAEKRIKYKHHIQEEVISDCVRFEYQDEFNSYLAGAKENGIVWHDLRKDPNDLPKENMEVITVGKTPKGALRKKVAFYFKNTKQFGLWNKEYDCYTQLHNVIAWCEIPQFKE